MANISEILALIRNKRKEKGITHEQIAKALGMTTVSYARIEKGETEMKLAVYIDICEYLGVDLLINKPEQQETSLITFKETDINDLATKRDINEINNKLDEVLNFFKTKKKK
jgi:transcriptional regulator with XRE-family HTH domain